jgi:hypothetical protein
MNEDIIHLRCAIIKESPKSANLRIPTCMKVICLIDVVFSINLGIGEVCLTWT